VTSPTRPAGRANGAELSIDLGHAPCCLRVAQSLQYAKRLKALSIAETIGARGILGDGLTHHMTLRFSQA
jgi:hypothetical protein